MDISYDIIRHVSAQLYSNPRKAIEELICNSYDAGATTCHVSLPADSKGALAVLDDGKSMDLKGLKNLWRVADSPKVKKGGQARIDNNRMQIGKFGVGKLAAFALGARLTHVACVGGNVRVVSVGQDEIKEKKGGKAPTFTVFRTTINEAKPLLEPYLKELPKPWEEGWPNWTLALVEEIDEDHLGRALKIGILRRMIATALPISARFKVLLEKQEVPRRDIAADEIEVKVDMIDLGFRKKLKEALQAYWAEALGEAKPEDVPEKYFDLRTEGVPNPQNVQQNVKGLVIPELGPVIGNAVLTKNSLTTDKLIERGYTNNGFAIYANGKLINPEDELFGVTQRSHAYWSKFLARVEIPGLDGVLLVQRNAVSENTHEAQIARTVMRTLFNYTRGKAQEIEKAEEYEPQAFGRRVKTFSPILGQMALAGLTRGDTAAKGLESLEIEFSTLGESGPAARYDPQATKILVNEDHPLITALDELGPNSKQLRQVIGEVLAGTQMATGYLRSEGVDEPIVERTAEIIDVAVRSAAGFVIDEVEEHIKAIEEASYAGDTPFEKAIISAFQSLRLVAQHLGESDQPDGIIEIPKPGAPNLKISVEAKGSKGVITHKGLAEAEVTRHSEENGCTNAIAIAREFAKDGLGGKDAALLRETKGKVPLITVAGVAKLLRLHKRRPFTYDKIEKILTTWTYPDDLEAFIEETWREMPDLGVMKLVLQVAHEQMTKDDTNVPEPGMILADERIRKRKLRRPELIHILETIQITTGMIYIKNPQTYEFELKAPPETILDALKRDPTGEGVTVAPPPPKGAIQGKLPKG
ncbi:MAG: ATP-binding protein [Euryarchaeota archaeon]|nr:ATP-binding protein [Euryarchaeota archaeon]